MIESKGVLVFSSNYALYGDMSRRVMDSLRQFTPEVEVYSIDEAFLNMAGIACEDLAAYARKIRSSVRQWTGIPISIGIAETETLAKLANRAAKKLIGNGVLDLTALRSDERDGLLSRIAVEDVWGVGPAISRVLKERNILTALDLRQSDVRWIKERFGVVTVRTVLELQGTPCIPLEFQSPSKKNICVSRSFSRSVETLSEMQEAVSTYATRAAEKARRSGLAASSLTVFVNTNRFKTEPQYNNAASFSLPVATADTQELIQGALRGLAAIFKKGFRYAKAGVLLNGLVPATRVQPDLFDDRDRERSGRLMKAMDAINADMGVGTVHFGSTGIQRPWQAKFMRRSPRYTTRWQELAVATTG